MLERGQMLVLNVVKWDISRGIVNMMEINHHLISSHYKQPSDAYDPVVGKWMTNLVATTPVTAKAMQSLLLELHRQKELKRAYRRHYKDIQTTSTNTSITSQPLTSIASPSTSKTVSTVKTTGTGSQVKKPLGKGKAVKPMEKGKKCVAFSATSTPTATTSTVSMPNLRNKLRDKAKVTIAMIQELTEESTIHGSRACY